jgi:glycosyltransferase involved in cell wall biosynthesis
VAEVRPMLAHRGLRNVHIQLDLSEAQKAWLYATCEGFLFPSLAEGFGLPPLEAMACGCPVVAAAAGAVPEVCGDAALWFDTAGPRRLTDALARLLEEQGLAAELRRRGLARAAMFSWRRAAETLLGLLPALKDAAA